MSPWLRFARSTLALCLFLTGAAHAAVVAGVQSGTLTSTGNGVQSVVLGQAVDPTKSVLFFHTRSNSNRPPGSMVRGTLASSTAVNFTRVTNESSAIDIHWYLVEFSSGVNVQRGQFSQSSSTTNVALATPVASTAQAFVLWSKTPASGDSIWSADDPVGGHLTSTSNVRFYAAGGNSSHVIDYQVVEYTNAAEINVQSGTLGMGTSSASVDATLATPVNVSSSFVLAGFTSPSSGADVGERMLRAELIDATTARFSRDDTGDNIDRVVWQVVELSDGSVVYGGLEGFSPGQAVRSVSVPGLVDVSSAVAFSGMQPVGGANMGSSDYSADDIIGTGSFTFALAPSSLTMQRNNSASSANVGWFVIDFAGFSAVLDARFDERQWTGAAGEVVDQASGLNGTALGGASNSGVDPALPGDPGTCRYGDFDGIDDFIEFADDPQLDMTAEFTAAIWVHPRVFPASDYKSILSKDTNYEFHVDSSGRVYWWWRDNAGNVRTLTSTASLSLDTWHHVAVTYRSGEQTIYVDGVNVGSSAFTGNLANNSNPLQIGQDQGLANRFWDGLLDEVRLYDIALSQTEVQGVMGQTQPCPVSPRAEWHFDEFGWNGTADEVVDYSGNDYHGVATNTITDVGRVCNAAALGATGTGDYLSLDAQAFDGLTDFTLGVWVRTAQTHDMALVSGARAGQFNELIYWFPSGFRFRPYLKGSNSGTIDFNGLNDGDWHFIAWTRSGSSNCGYMDDVLQGCTTLTSSALALDAGGLIVGQEQDSVGGSFVTSQALDGELDELILFDEALSAAEIADIRANNLAGLNWDGSPRICPVLGATGFVIGHDNAGIHCLDEPVTVTAVDAAGVPDASYGNQVTLTTSTSRGTWTLASGSGTLSDPTADDGQATYTFAAADNGTAQFWLSYPEGASPFNVDVFQSDDVTIRDDDSEGDLTFAPNGFTLTASQLTNPPPSPVNDPIGPQTAGADFPIHITAYGVTDDDPLCGVIESYETDHMLEFSMAYDNPASGTLRASVDGLATNTGLSQTVTFTAGQAVVTAKYKDVGSISIAASDSTTYSHVIAGGSNDFVVRPATFAVTRVESSGGQPNQAPATANGAAFVPAGEAFVVDVDALDAEGDVTPNYGLETPAESVRVSSDSVFLPVGGRNGTTGDVLNGASFAASGTPGRFTNTNVIFDEVGIIQLRAAVADGDYLGAGQVLGNLSANVGRFFPASFQLVSDSVAGACGGSTYMDQDAIDLDYRLQAWSAVGNVTENYDEDLPGAATVATLSHVAEAADGGVDLGARLSAVPTKWTLGEVLVNQPDVTFARAGAPDGPFDPLQLGLRVVDTLDSVALAGLNMNPQTSGDCVAAANCDARSLGGTTRVVFGRLMVLPSFGPETRDLDVGLEAQDFTGTSFQRYPVDDCSTYNVIAASLDGTSYTGNLSAGDTSLIAPIPATALVDGEHDPAAPLTLSAPGLGSDGSVDVILDVPAWLEFDWFGGGVQDPSGSATFGRYRGHDRIIYWSEQ